MTDWRINPVPGRGLRRVNGGELALLLQISRGGRHQVIAELELTPAEAESLHAALCYALGEQPPPPDAHECRRPVRYPGGRQRY
ncbi:hypothetical protein DNK48_18785 [Streptomyces malaysiensis subsp. malaysiensis]|uniref:hypothetical protein n=1 Tax=Streptomyces malaysiensis TaxID=92644 RepID=UPI000BFD81EC|nr:hypothetical protein [Streptomyces malaysiensis]QDL71105.1 hypothetical protein DNK48_18785 [Streptomyces malaysiensis]